MLCELYGIIFLGHHDIISPCSVIAFYPPQIGLYALGLIPRIQPASAPVPLSAL